MKTLSIIALLLLTLSVTAGEPLKVEIKEVQKQTTFVIKRSVKPEGIGMALGLTLPKVKAYCDSKNITPISKPLALFTELKDGKYAMEAGMVVPDGSEGAKNIVVSSLPAGKVAVTTHLGDYKNLSKTYEAMEKYLKDNKLEAAGPKWEFYISDPTTTKPEEVRTDVYYLLK